MGWFPEGYLNIMMQSYQYRDSHYKDKMVSWPSYLYNGNLHIRKYGLYIETGPNVSEAKNAGQQITGIQWDLI